MNLRLNNSGQRSRLVVEIPSAISLRAPARVPQPSTLDAFLAFSLIEILVVVALLSVIIIGLVAMFGQVQHAFRAGMTQVDVLEAGRATADLLARDLVSITPGYQNPNNATNFNVCLRDFAPLLQPLPGNQGPGRTNLLEELFFLGRENQTWSGTGYFVRTNDSAGNLHLPDGGVGALYRFNTNYSDANFRQFPRNFNRDFNAALFQERRNGTNLANKIMDGVVHFKVTVYDTNGVRIVKNLQTTSGNSDIFQYTTTVAPGEMRLCSFYSNAVPAFVEFELGVLEQRALERVKSIPSGPARRAYLEDQAGKVHLFRMRVPVRNVDPVAYQ